MKANFGQQCPACRQPVVRGAEILRHSTLGWVHAECHNEDPCRPARQTVAAIPVSPDDEPRHECYADVEFHVNCGDNVLLVGPSGCGKTYLGEQLARLRGLKFSAQSMGGGITESKLVGRCTPNVSTGENVFQTTEFLQRFEFGGVILIDEFDAADPNVALVVNTATANGYLYLDRPGNPRAVKHVDCFILASANTWGHGADRMFVGRNQLDAATLDRFVAIPMDYDRTLEARLVKNEDLLLHCWELRDRMRAGRLERCLSTRFVVRAAQWIDAGRTIDYVDRMLFAGWSPSELAKVK